MPKAVEKRRFQMHSKLLYDVILRQAGSLSKAILEAVMNSVDAKASECHITLDLDHVRITDNGRGFRSKQEIEEWFEVFGQPHEESEGKVYGRFRMGRGQLFAYGSNTWQTGKFVMEIDVKNNGLDYELKSASEPRKGCQIDIDLYEKLLPSDQHDEIRDVKLWCRWIPISVYLNGTKISNTASDFDWTEVTDDAYIEFNNNAEFRVYNQGVFVREYSKVQFGIGGELVSRKPLKVNFARNEIQSDCPIWRKLKAMVDEQGCRSVVKKSNLDDMERLKILKAVLADTIPSHEVSHVKILTAVTGRHYAATSLAGFNFSWTICEDGDRVGDTIHRQKRAFVVASSMLTKLGLDQTGFKSLLSKLARHCHLRYVPFEELQKEINGNFVLIPRSQHRDAEKNWLYWIRKACWGILYRIRQNDDRLCGYDLEIALKRQITIGTGPAYGWTDGQSYIAIERSFLASHQFNMRGFIAVASLVLHELCHDVSDMSEHAHDQDFYEKYHDLSDAVIGLMTEEMFKSHIMSLKRKKKKTKKDLKTLDQNELMSIVSEEDESAEEFLLSELNEVGDSDVVPAG